MHTESDACPLTIKKAARARWFEQMAPRAGTRRPDGEEEAAKTDGPRRRAGPTVKLPLIYLRRRRHLRLRVRLNKRRWSKTGARGIGFGASSR